MTHESVPAMSGASPLINGVISASSNSTPSPDLAWFILTDGERMRDDEGLEIEIHLHVEYDVPDVIVLAD